MEINLANIDFNPGQGGGGEAVINSLSVTSNGVYRVPQGVDGYNPVTVSVPTPEFITETLSVSVNGTYNPGAGIDGYSQVTVDVHPLNSFSGTYTSNGSYSITGEFNGGEINVSVPAPQFVTETLSVSVNGTYNPGAGIDGYSQVTVDVPNPVGIFYNLSTITSIESNAFNLSNNALNSFIEYIDLPECSYIGSFGFYQCYALNRCNLPECGYIGDSAFRSCSITSLDLPKCSYIGYTAFALNSNLSHISLPECEYIGPGALRQTNITELNLPKCMSIMEYALSIPTLTKLTIGTSSVCSITNNTIVVSDINSLSIFVPASLLNAYKTASVWSTYSNRIFPIE